MAFVPITTLPPAPSRSGGSAAFASDADAFVAALALLVTEMNLGGGEINAIGIQTALDEAATNQDAIDTAADAIVTTNNVSHSRDWAITPENVPVPIAAGGNGTTDFSSIHHAAKSEASSQSALVAAAAAGSAAGLPTFAGHAAKQLIVNNAEDGVEWGQGGATAAQSANIVLNSFNIAVNGGMTVQNMVDGVSDVFTDETGINTVNSVEQVYNSAGDYYETTTISDAFPPVHDTTYVKTTSASNGYLGYRVTDPSRPLIGGALNASWRATAPANQRLSIDLGSAVTIGGCRYSNYHNSGGVSSYGAKNFTFWGSNDPAAFADTTWASDVGWVQLTTSITQLAQHVAADIEDIQSFLISNTDAYRYYCFKFADSWGGGNMGVRNVTLRRALVNMSLLTEGFTSLSQPESAYVVVNEEDIDAVTLNTDLTAWVSRSIPITYTVDFATDNKLTSAAHGLSNGARVILTSDASFPMGLNGTTAYYVVNATANTFETSLTDGGVAVAITSNGSGILRASDYSQAILTEDTALSSGRILTGTADLSTQAAGTEITTIIQTKNLKYLKIHSLSTQWS